MKNFILAMRPKTLLAGLVPPLATYFYFISVSPERPLSILFYCLIGALAIQVATNFFNDLIDFKKGADAIRVGPTRVTASGLVNPQTILRWAIIALLIAALVSIPLVLRGGLWILIPGILSLYLSYGYTGGPYPLAYRGLGELFVFLFFGLFSVLGTYYLLSLSIDHHSIILSIIYGLLTTTFIAVNNLRDRNQDKIVKKLTLATRVNHKTYRAFILFTIFAPYILILFTEKVLMYPFIFSLVIAFKLGSIVIKKEGAQLNEGLKFSAIHILFFFITSSLLFNL